MLQLKQMSWNDNWKEYIEYGRTNVSNEYKWKHHKTLNSPFFYQIISVMMQLENKMSVYEAFLKGLEVYYASTTCGKELFLQEYRRLQNQIYNNMKKGIIDEFLMDFHLVMINVGMKWCSND